MSLVDPQRGTIGAADALFASEAEPRILELLPALLVARPSMFSDPSRVPEELAPSVRALRRGECPPGLRGITGEAQARWMSRLRESGQPVTETLLGAEQTVTSRK